LIDSVDVVLFDNDGVLVDTEPLFFRATREVLATVGVGLDEAAYRAISLVRGENMFELAAARGVSPEEIRGLRRERDARYSESIREGVDVLPGVRSTLARLQGVRPMAIVTSAERWDFDGVHARTGLLPHFEFVLASGDYARHKPHPDPYLTAAARFGVAPERCIVIEDTQRGVAAAHAAGMRCIAIPQPLSRGSDFGRAEHVLDSMTELLGVIGLGG
jgi:HAD superfamily hydrolase (TIGR01509 family)